MRIMDANDNVNLNVNLNICDMHTYRRNITAERYMPHCLSSAEFAHGVIKVNHEKTK